MLEGLSAESGAPAQGYGQFRGDNPRYNVKALHSKGSTNFNMFVEDKGGLGDYDFVMPSVSLRPCWPYVVLECCVAAHRYLKAGPNAGTLRSLHKEWHAQ